MRAKLVLLAVTGLLASGQEARVFRFHHIETPQSLNEFATLVRVLSDNAAVSVETEPKSMTLSGTPAQIAIAEWLFTELDRQTVPDSVAQEFRVSNNGDDVIRLLFPKHAATIQDFQEEATAVRTVAEIRRLFTYNALKALAIRGTADQIAAAEFMIGEMDQPASAKRVDSRPYQMIDSKGDTEVRIFHVPYATTIQQNQEVATMVRTLGQIQRVFTYNAARDILVRGSPGQVAAAAWMIHELGQPLSASKRSSQPFLMEDPENLGDNVIRVFYIQDVGSVQAFQQVATGIRVTTKIRRVFTYNSSRAMAVRGTAEEIAMTEQILKDRQVALK